MREKIADEEKLFTESIGNINISNKNNMLHWQQMESNTRPTKNANEKKSRYILLVHFFFLLLGKQDNGANEWRPRNHEISREHTYCRSIIIFCIFKMLSVANIFSGFYEVVCTIPTYWYSPPHKREIEYRSGTWNMRRRNNLEFI